MAPAVFPRACLLDPFDAVVRRQPEMDRVVSFLRSQKDPSHISSEAAAETTRLLCLWHSGGVEAGKCSLTEKAEVRFIRKREKGHCEQGKLLKCLLCINTRLSSLPHSMEGVASCIQSLRSQTDRRSLTGYNSAWIFMVAS